MESFSDIKNKKKIVEEFFCWVYDKDNIELFEEVDLSLAPDYYDPNIYYTKELFDFFSTFILRILTSSSFSCCCNS